MKSSFPSVWVWGTRDPPAKEKGVFYPLCFENHRKPHHKYTQKVKSLILSIANGIHHLTRKTSHGFHPC
jgi:hypothetical protein